MEINLFQKKQYLHLKEALVDFIQVLKNPNKSPVNI